MKELIKCLFRVFFLLLNMKQMFLLFFVYVVIFYCFEAKLLYVTNYLITESEELSR